MRRCRPGRPPSRAEHPGRTSSTSSRLHDDVGREAPEARERLPREAELAVRDVLDDQEPVAVRQLDQQRPPLGREADTGRVLVVGDAVDELRAEPTCEPPLQLLDVEPVLVHADGDQRRLEAPERLDRAEVGGGFDDDEVAGVEERLADELERLDRAARDHELVVCGTAALQRLEPGCEGSRSPARPRVGAYWNAAASSSGCQFLEQRRDALARKRLRVGESAREGDQVRDSEERQHGGDPVADLTPRPRSDQSVPPSHLGRRGHGPILRPLLPATGRTGAGRRAGAWPRQCGIPATPRDA